MLRILCFLCFLLIAHSCSEKNDNKVDHKLDKVSLSTVEDTSFLINRVIGPNYRYQVYESYSSLHYERLMPTLSDSAFSLINNTYSSRQNIIKNHSIELYDLPTKWTEVINIKGQYYLNLPSDGCNSDQKIVTDSCLILITCEGPMPIAFQEVEKINENKYRLSFNQTYKKKDLFITIVDRSKGLAIWHDENSQKLYAFLKNNQLLPMAVADCNGNKCPDDLKSEYIDIEALLNAIE